MLTDSQTDSQTGSKYEALLLRARRRFNEAVEAEREIRQEFEIDLSFISGSGQWREDVRAARESGPSPRPCLVFNKCLPPVTQLGNQARQNKPAIQVSPVNSAGDPDTAKVLAGMVRHIEYDSDADQAYDTALFYAAAGSFGYWRYTCEYADNESFDQDIKTVTVEDPLSIYLDCYARKPDRSDMKWAFVIDKMSKDAFEARFGAEEGDLSSDFCAELASDGWRDDDSRQVAEYWEVDSIKKTLRIEKAPDGTLHPRYLEDLDKEEIAGIEWELEDPDDPGSRPKEREVEIPRVMQYIINGAKVLEKPTKWDGDTIPIVMVTGLEMVVRGKKKIFSMTRFARDPQQLLNYYKTMEAETIALAPKPKWVGAVGQFKSKPRDWQRANIDQAAYLQYDPIAVGDKQAPPPQWVTFDPPVQALSIGAAAASDDIKSSTGYYDPSLGQQKADQSGVAIAKLQRQGDVSNFHFMDNLARAIKRGGRILIQLIPYKYDTAREVRIIGEDQKERVIRVNAPAIDENGKLYHHKLNEGKYDVTVRQGPSYNTQRESAFDQLTALAQTNEQVMAIGGDIILGNSDIVGADVIAKRWKKMLPQQLQDDDDDQNGQISAAQAKQLQLANQALQQTNGQLIQMIKQRLVEAREKSASAERIAILNAESRERIADQGNQAKIEAALATSKNAALNDLADRNFQIVQQDLATRADLLHNRLTVEADAEAAEREFANDQQLQQAQQQHQASMAQANQAHQQQMATQQQQAAAQQQQLAQQAEPQAA